MIDLIRQQSENLVKELDDHCEAVWRQVGPTNRDSIAVGFLLQKVASLQLLVAEMMGHDLEEFVEGYYEGVPKDEIGNLVMFRKKT